MNHDSLLDRGLRRRLASGREELDGGRHDLDGAPPLAVGLLPRAAPKPPVDSYARTPRQVLRAQLRLPVPRSDADEVGPGRRGPIDREQEARHLLTVRELAQLDLGSEVPEQHD